MEVRRRHHIVGVREDQAAHRIFAWQIAFAHERIGHFTHSLPAAIFETISAITSEKPVRTEVGRGLCRKTQTQAVHVVAGDGRIDRPKIEFGGMLGVERGFDKVFNKSLGRPNDRLHPANVLNAADEEVHLRFRLREPLGAMGVPKTLLLHLRVGERAGLSAEVEARIRDSVEGKVGVVGGALHLKFLNTFGHFEHHQHIVLREHLFSGG